MKRFRSPEVDRRTETESYSHTPAFEHKSPAQGNMERRVTPPPEPYPTLWKFAYFPYKGPPCPADEAKARAYPRSIESLVALAEPEDWSGPSTTAVAPHGILKNYLWYTYQRLNMEKKIKFSADNMFAAFNTGLLTPLAEEIFAFFAKNRTTGPGAQPWCFDSWKKESDSFFMGKFPSLPEMAEYAAIPADLVYDVRQTLTLDYEHIALENRDRFPPQLQNGKLPQMSLKYAQDLTMKRVRRNYKLAIPQWYPPSGRVRNQLLLPLDLTQSGTADVALVVSQIDGGGYRGNTILTLEMAYSNARLVARPDSDWLKPQVSNNDASPSSTDR